MQLQTGMKVFIMSIRKYGIIQSVCLIEKTCIVRIEGIGARLVTFNDISR